VCLHHHRTAGLDQFSVPLPQGHQFRFRERVRRVLERWVDVRGTAPHPGLADHVSHNARSQSGSVDEPLPRRKQAPLVSAIRDPSGRVILPHDGLRSTAPEPHEQRGA